MLVRVVLDLLHEFKNTIVLSLFHRMWHSKYSKFEVNLVWHWLLVTCIKANNGFPRSITIWVWMWLVPSGRWATLNQFLHPIMSQGNLWRRSRWFIYFLVYDFSNLHPKNFQDTLSWECVVKDDRVRSCLIELQYFPWSKIDVDPICCVFWRFFRALCCIVRGVVLENRSSQDPYDVYGIHMQKECFCLLLKFWAPGINPALTVDCKLIARPMW